jgi:hypothetical protein
MGNKSIGVAVMITALAAVGGSVVGAATSQPSGFGAPWFQNTVTAACVVFFIGLVLFVWGTIASWQRKPRLEFGDPYPEEQSIGTVTSSFGSVIGVTGVGSIFDLTTSSSTAASFPGVGVSGSFGSSFLNATFVYVPIYNPKRPERRDAEGVVAKIHFYPSSPMRPMDGRWADPPESQLTQPTQRATDKTILANGNKEPLDVAMKYVDDPCCYAFNNENRKLAPHDLRFRGLPDEITPVDIELSSTTAQPLKGKFELHHQGIGSKPVLKYKGTFVRHTLKHPWAGAYREKLYAP